MKWLACFLTLVYSAAIARPVLGCDVYDKRTPDSSCVVMKVDGRQGAWFDLKTADGIRLLKLEYPQLKQAIKDYERLQALRDYQVKQYQDAWALSLDISNSLLDEQAVYVKQARLARQARDDAVAELNAWYRSPVLWAGGGVVITLGVGALVAYGLGKF